MTDVRQDTSDEKRRRLLKGALGASTVMTLGYGGAAAAASISCLAKLETSNYPSPQFVIGTTSPAGWSWLKVDVGKYQIKLSGAGTINFDGFNVEGKIYDKIDHGLRGTLGMNGLEEGGGPREVGWVLKYYDQNGRYVGTYPYYVGKVASGNVAIGAATTSCETSILASAVSRTFIG